MTNLRFVITGGPGAGKTTILNALAERGYRYAAESARAIIRERLASGLSPRPPLAQFGNEILRRDIARYRETRVTDHPVFFDRGIVDALCVLDQQHAIALGEAEAYVRLFPYNNVVLLMPPWEAIYRTDAERDQTFAEWCTTWYMREETLEAAFTHLVNYHHKLPLSQVWGSGILSSSDGQRFPVSGKNRHARVFPPPLGYGQGLTFYSWTSDQLSQYGSKPVSITARDATYVLDAILGNETELAVVEHTTDTAGATEMIFALFDLLGLRFTPRLRDIGSRRLYRSGAIDLHHYPRLQPHITGRINRQRVLDWWDTMLRAAGSMKLGHVTASR